MSAGPHKLAEHCPGPCGAEAGAVGTLRRLYKPLLAQSTQFQLLLQGRDTPGLRCLPAATPTFHCIFFFFCHGNNQAASEFAEAELGLVCNQQQEMAERVTQLCPGVSSCWELCA